MKNERNRISDFSYIAAFVVGVILFASSWKAWFGPASSTVVLTGMTGVAIAVIIFWLRNEFKNSKDN